MEFKLLKYWEHYNELISDDENRFESSNYTSFFPKKKGDDISCFIINKKSDASFHLNTTYLIGVDWVKRHETALYIAPKLNSKHYNINENEKHYEIDFINMLFSAMQHVDVSKEIDELVLVKWQEPYIEISQKEDLLTPFLVIEFLDVLKKIVRKGLKKTYYRVEQNLNSRVKGKVMVANTVKHNVVKNKNLLTYCNYEEFGLNNNENRLLKKALIFIKRYLPTYNALTNSDLLINALNYITPAFQNIDGTIELNQIKHYKHNVLYKEYDDAIRLAKLILKRFGYNISNTVNLKILTPPFFSEMSKLFELYTLALLKNHFKDHVDYHFTDYGNELDFILNTNDYKMVIDAKYKLKYLYGKYDEDARQVSGYARLESVYKFFGKEYPESIDCLIIHPDQENGITDFYERNLKEKKIPSYHGIYKIGVKLPVIK